MIRPPIHGLPSVYLAHAVHRRLLLHVTRGTVDPDVLWSLSDAASRAIGEWLDAQERADEKARRVEMTNREYEHRHLFVSFDQSHSARLRCACGEWEP